MARIRHEDEQKRAKADAKIARAHEIALDQWPEDYEERLSGIVRGNPWFRPLDPWPTDAAFIANRRRIRRRLETRRVTHRSNRGGPLVVAGWEAYDPDD